MGVYATVPETLKSFYDAEYLYNVLPLDVVGDTLGDLQAAHAAGVGTLTMSLIVMPFCESA